MVREGDGYSVLFWAIHHWRVEICKYLLRQDAHRYIKTKGGSSPHELAWTRILSLASPDRAKDIPRLRELFEDDDVFDNLGFSVLHMIVTGMKSDRLESILDNDISDLDKPDKQNKTPLLWAAARGDCKHVGTLLKYGASTTQKDRDGRTALSWAAWSGSSGCVTCVRLLLQHGADPNARDTRYHESPLHWALKGSHTVDIVTALLDYGADIASTSARGEQPLHRAVISGALQSVLILLDRGADINASMKPSYDTPLHIATGWNSPLLVNLFLERRAKLTERADGKNILHIAAARCDAAVFDILLSFRLTRITAEDTDGDGKTTWDILKQRHETGSGGKFSSEEEYELNRASLARLLELGKFC
ncbi:ankyrin [Lophiostoma macrostomum CBS 122681]|uniref:Ankyrin n=1 Tax=Lophiostoma macrostomum CBS 122681 TaxID=1314788 RepID=A0A6A6TKL6_9PLEO|nr:ankyrin [Lophiostoma macrostomum CBS 122681]